MTLVPSWPLRRSAAACSVAQPSQHTFTAGSPAAGFLDAQCSAQSHPISVSMTLVPSWPLRRSAASYSDQRVAALTGKGMQGWCKHCSGKCMCTYVCARGLPQSTTAL